MLHLFKPRDYRKVITLFGELGFTSDDFHNFHLQQLAAKLKNNQAMFPFVLEIMRQIKLTHLTSLKIVLLCLEIIHICRASEMHLQIFQFLHELQNRINVLTRVKSRMKVNDSGDLLSTSKELIEGRIESVALDLPSILMSKIVLPLIHFQHKIIYSYQLLYSRSGNGQVREEEIWLRMNLLRKIAELGSDIEAIGRYYFKETAQAIICMMKVINFDIQLLYKRILEYFRKKFAAIEVILQQDEKNAEKNMMVLRVQQFLMMVEELEIINQKLRVMYNGRYFVFHFIKINVYIPILFNGEEHIELLYKINQFHKNRDKKNKSLELGKLQSFGRRNNKSMQTRKDHLHEVVEQI